MKRKKIHKYTEILKQTEGFLVFAPNPFSILPASWAFTHWSAKINNQFVCLFPAFSLQDSPIEHGSQSPNQNDCGTWVRNINGGVFTSPNYPNTYPPNKECVYILEGTAEIPPLPSAGHRLCLSQGIPASGGHCFFKTSSEFPPPWQLGSSLTFTK